MRDCYGRYPNTSGFPCNLCFDLKKCRHHDIKEIVKDRDNKLNLVSKIKSEITNLDEKIRDLCKHDLVLLKAKTIPFEVDDEYMCVRCKKFLFLGFIPKNSKVVTFTELEKMPEEEKVEYI
ncbi:MAG: hypothetical protein FH761_16720 [Firmicutes bacterium]|nr:hypothetical protein [Bacillota bacterium]